MPGRGADPSDRLSELEAAVRSITGHRLTARARTQFSAYLELLLKWNRVHRLTGLGSAGDIVRKLFLDSVLFLVLIPDRPVSLLDMGAGAGVPGVPLRIVDPGISLTLVESRRKPVSFLLGLKRELGLDDVRIIHARAEAALVQCQDLKGEYDVVVSRAVRLSEPLVKVAFDYLKRGGVLIASGPPPEERWSHTFAKGLQIKTIQYPRLAISRTFLTAVKEVDP